MTLDETAPHLYSVGAKLPWRGRTVEIVELIPLDSPYVPENTTSYVGLFNGMHRVTLAQRDLIRQGRAA